MKEDRPCSQSTASKMPAVAAGEPSTTPVARGVTSLIIPRGRCRGRRGQRRQADLADAAARLARHPIRAADASDGGFTAAPISNRTKQDKGEAQ